jgi:hypothetical protein
MRNRNFDAEVTIERIAPITAKELLSTRGKNRKLRQTSVDRMALDMKQGEWRLGPDALTVIKGELRNGQHRLTAVIQSNIACDFLVLRTGDDELFKIIDCGIRRSVPDSLQQMGVKNARDLAAASTWILKYNTRSLTIKGRKTPVKWTGSEVTEYASCNAELLNSIWTELYPLYAKSHIIPISMGIALSIIGGSLGQIKTDEFVLRLFDGQDLSRGTPVYYLREMLAAQYQKPKKYPMETRFALAMKALRFTLRGDTIAQLKVTEGEQFPYLD